MSDSRLGGVRLNEPRGSLLESVRKHAEEAASTLRPGETGALVGHVTNTGMNVTVVHRGPDGWSVTAYVGKDWGSELYGGATVIKSW